MNEIAKFFSYDTRKVNHQDYVIFYAVGLGSCYYPNTAVVMNMDCHLTLIDIDDYDYLDFDEFIDLVVLRYEGRI